MVIGTIYFQYWHEQYRIQLDAETADIGDVSCVIEGFPFGKKLGSTPINRILNEKFD